MNEEKIMPESLYDVLNEKLDENTKNCHEKNLDIFLNVPIVKEKICQLLITNS